MLISIIDNTNDTLHIILHYIISIMTYYVILYCIIIHYIVLYDIIS